MDFVGRAVAVLGYLCVIFDAYDAIRTIDGPLVYITTRKRELGCRIDCSTNSLLNSGGLAVLQVNIVAFSENILRKTGRTRGPGQAQPTCRSGSS